VGIIATQQCLIVCGVAIIEVPSSGSLVLASTGVEEQGVKFEATKPE
jgi:hypothetical protein